MAKEKEPTFGEQWAKQDSPIGVLPPAEQVSDPEEEIDPELEGDDEIEPEMGLVPIKDPEEPEESAPAGEADKTEDADGDGDLLGGIAIYAKLKENSVKDGASGVTWVMKFQIDTAYAADLIMMMGEHDFGLVFDKKVITEKGITIKAVPTRENSADGVVTTLELHGAQSERTFAKKMTDFVGLTKPMELTEVQQTLFGAKAE